MKNTIIYWFCNTSHWTNTPEQSKLMFIKCHVWVVKHMDICRQDHDHPHIISSRKLCFIPLRQECRYEQLFSSHRTRNKHDTSNGAQLVVIVMATICLKTSLLNSTKCCYQKFMTDDVILRVILTLNLLKLSQIKEFWCKMFLT